MGEGGWEHDELQADMARAKREAGEIVAQRVGLGPGARGGQLDVVSLKPSWTQYAVTGYEVKVTRSDFLSDVRKGKYERYLPWTRRLYFATPAGMVKKDEVPAQCGLMVRSEKGWSGVVAPHVRQLDTETQELVSRTLLMRTLDSPWTPRSRRVSRGQRIEEVAASDELRKKAHLLGERVKKKLEQERLWRRQYERAVRTLLEALGRGEEDVEMPEAGQESRWRAWRLEGGHRLSELAEELANREVPERLVEEALQAGEISVKGAQRALERQAEQLDRSLEKLDELRGEIQQSSDKA